MYKRGNKELPGKVQAARNFSVIHYEIHARAATTLCITQALWIGRVGGGTLRHFYHLILHNFIENYTKKRRTTKPSHHDMFFSPAELADDENQLKQGANKSLSAADGVQCSSSCSLIKALKLQTHCYILRAYKQTHFFNYKNCYMWPRFYNKSYIKSGCEIYKNDAILDRLVLKLKNLRSLESLIAGSYLLERWREDYFQCYFSPYYSLLSKTKAIFGFYASKLV